MGPRFVEEFAIDRPATVGVPHRLSDQERALRFDGFLKRETLSLGDHIAEALIRGTVFVHRKRCRCNPAFIDSSAVCAVRVDVARVELESAPQNQIGPWNPRGTKSQNSFARFQSLPR
jgi:hypothetical protein